MQKRVNLVDLVKSFQTRFCLQNSASIQPRTSLVKFSRSPRTDTPGLAGSYVLTREHNLARENNSSLRESIFASTSTGLLSSPASQREAAHKTLGEVLLQHQDFEEAVKSFEVRSVRVCIRRAQLGTRVAGLRGNVAKIWRQDLPIQIL